MREPKTSDLPVLGLAPESQRHQVYSEEAFRYFLALERKRAERSSRSFLLMLIEWDGRTGGGATFDPRVATKLFALVWPCLRETDYLGWYHDGRVAGAVLTQLGESNGTDVSGLVRERVGRALQEGFPRDTAARLLVRVYELPPSGRLQS